MSFLKRLFGSGKTQSSSVQARQETAAAPPVPTPKPVPARAASQSASSVFSSAGTVSPSEFPSRAAWSHANCVVPIREIADLIRSLDTALTNKGASKETMQNLWFFSLIGLCPQCGNPCGPDALKMFVVFKAMSGANVMFTGQSGGGDRMFRGQCSNASCSSRYMQIFWCPDIDPDAVAYFKSRGLELKDCSTKREGVWPLSDKKTATAPIPPPSPTVRRPPPPQAMPPQPTLPTVGGSPAMDSDENALVKRRDAEIIARLGAYLYVNQMKPIISAAVEAQLRQGSRIIGEVDSSTQSNLDALLRTIYGVHSKVALELGMSDEDFRKTFSNALAEANKKSDAEREAWSPHAFQVFAKHVHLAEKYYTSGLHLPLMSVAHPPVGAKAKADFITAVTELRDKNVPYEEAASQLKASGNFDFELIKDVVLDESVQVSVRQKAMFIGAVSGDADFIAFLANALVLGKDPKLMIDNPKYGSFGMWSDAKDICERNGMRFE